MMSARVYLMKMVKDCKYVSIMSLQDEQWKRTVYSVCILLFSYCTTACSQNINKQNVNMNSHAYWDTLYMMTDVWTRRKGKPRNLEMSKYLHLLSYSYLIILIKSKRNKIFKNECLIKKVCKRKREEKNSL